MHEPATAPLRLWNARLVDPGSGRIVERGTLVAEGGRIAEIAAAAGAAPDGAIDVGGRTVLPGLIDAHSHVASDMSRSPGFGPPPPLHGEDPRPRAIGHYVLAQAARATIASGFTTLRDVGSFDDEAIALRQAVDLGVVPGPRIVSCGRIVTATCPGANLFGTMYAEADGPWQMRRAVRRQHRRGADFVKLMATGARSVEREDSEPAQMTREELAAAVDEAHRIGLRVAAHAEGLAGTRLAIEERVDTIEHGPSLHRDPRLLAAMAADGQVLVPTLSTFHDVAERFSAQWRPSLVERAKAQLEEAYLTLTAARDGGVAIASGFDSGPPGAGAWEVVRMAEGGLGTMGALAAATLGGAAALGRDDLGRLRPGAVADLVVVAGDPVSDVRVLVRPGAVRLVIQAGRITAGRDLDPPARLRPPGRDESGAAPAGPPSPCWARAR
jgi:imidazolonepropionase-like amidohydrolase